MCCSTTASHGNDIASILPAKLPIVKRHADLDQATFSAHITRTYDAVVWLDAVYLNYTYYIIVLKDAYGC